MRSTSFPVAIALCMALAVGGAFAMPPQTQTFLPTGPGLLTELANNAVFPFPEPDPLPNVNWDMVNETPPDDSATFVRNVDGITASDLYAFGLPANWRGHIQSVTVSVRTNNAVELGGTVPTIELIVADGPLVVAFDSFTPSGAIWADRSVTLSTNPVTGHLWRPGELKRLQWGLRIGPGSLAARCTRYEVAVNLSDPDARLLGRRPPRWR